jgi:hypothetical protein
MSEKDFMSYLNGETENLQAKQITKMPENFKTFVLDKSDKILEKDTDKQPYWFRDNKKIIDKIIK